MTNDRQRLAAMLRAMFIKAHSVTEMIAISGFSGATVRSWLADLRSAGVVYIERYDGVTPFWKAGLNVTDAKRPAPLTRAQIQAAYRGREAKKNEDLF